MTANNYAKALSEFDNDNIFFVIVGAMNGVAHDALFPFAFKNKNWSGLLIEPISSYFEELKVNYENRDNLIFENVAITDKQETKDIYTIPREHIQNQMVPSWCDGISTFNLERSAISYDGIKDKIITKQVQCCLFKDLVDKHNIKNIDILQIDVEGHDLIVFNQIWSLGFRPKLIYIEIVHLDQKQKDYLLYVLQNNNYKIKDEGDNLCAIQKEIVVTHFPKRKRVAFYIYPLWAFGAIHSALCKELYKYDIDADLLDWSPKYSVEQFKDFEKIYDLFVTTPGHPIWVLTEFAGIDYNKVIAVTHSRADLVEGIQYKNNFDALLNFASITPYFKKISKNLGITREMKIVQNGIHFNRFYKPISKNLNILGYAGSLKFHFEDCKRSHLAMKIAESVNLPLNVSNINGGKPFICMPSFYSEVDSIIMSSNEDEACGLPIMEAAAAGRLPISARVGIARDFVHPPGIILPLEEKTFVEKGIENILELQKNPVKFKQLCSEAQQFAYENYDWKHVIHMWADVINNV